MKGKEKGPKKNSNYSEAFTYAIEGLLTAFKEERNIRSHLGVGIVVILVCLLLPMSAVEWIGILLVIFLVIITELINTVIENLVDLVTEDYHPLAKKVKDVAAGIVLVTSFFSVIVGLIILLPKLTVFLF